jgi:hypothetical protein
VVETPLYELLEQKRHDPKSSRYFLCGAPEFVRELRKKLYLSGASLDRILADPFEPFS